MVEKLQPHDFMLVKQNQMIEEEKYEEESKERLYKSYKYAQLNVTSSIGTQKSGYFSNML